MPDTPQAPTDATNDDTPTPDTPDAPESASDDIPTRKLRQRAQAAEADRDAANERVNALLRAEVGRLAADALSNPGDIFEYGGVDPADLTGDDGFIDPGKVADAVDALITARPGLAKAELRNDSPGLFARAGQFTKPRTPERKKSWSNVLDPQRIRNT